MVVIIVGYVIKEGLIVGLCIMEYFVDVVFNFEGDCYFGFCMVCVMKNCYGLVDEVGCFEMIDVGIMEVLDLFGLFILDNVDF